MMTRNTPNHTASYPAAPMSGRVIGRVMTMIESPSRKSPRMM